MSSGAGSHLNRIAGSDEGPLLLFLVLYAGELTLYSLIGAVYDRYLYPMVPVASILVLRGGTNPYRLSRSHALGHAAFAWLLVSALAVAANSFAYDTARAREGAATVAMGYDARVVDAGYEWVGYNGKGPEMPFSNPASLNWWQDNWPTFRPCAVVSNSRLDLPGYRVVRENASAYRRFLWFGPMERLYVYGALANGCPRAIEPGVAD
jgi:hypothetical protein